MSFGESYTAVAHDSTTLSESESHTYKCHYFVLYCGKYLNIYFVVNIVITTTHKTSISLKLL